MRFTAFNPFRNWRWALTTLVAALVGAGGCNPFRPAFRPTIFSGGHLSHRLRFSGGFERPPNTLWAEAYFRFRTKVNAPNTLLVGACAPPVSDWGQQLPSGHETCSPNIYSIDTIHGHAVSKASSADWDGASEVEGSRRSGAAPWKTADPLFFISKITSSAEGRFRFGGIDYGNPEKWFIEPKLQHTLDNRLVVLSGVDERRLPSGAVLVGDRIGGGAYGNYMIDFFESSKGRRLASLRMDCGMATAHCGGYVWFVNSRWVAFALTTDLSEALLFDFESELPSEKK